MEDLKIQRLPLFEFWHELFSNSWYGLMGWFAVLFTIILAAITILRYFAATKPHSNSTAYYQVAHVSFLIFFGGVGLTPFFLPPGGHGRPSAVIVSIIIGRTLQSLAIGSCLFLTASVSVFIFTKMYPRLSLLEIGPTVLLLITWCLIAGSMLIIPTIPF